MVIIYALLSACSYGISDFMGGLSSRKNSPLTTVAWSQVAGLLTALIAAPLIGAVSVPPVDILWGMAAGLVGSMGVGLLFRGLSTGLASVVSPTAALTGAVLPVVYGLLAGERPSLLTWMGVALALPAILLLSMEKGGEKSSVFKSLRLGFLAGTAFGGFFILIAQTGDDSGMWPLLAARGITVPLYFLILLFGRRAMIPAGGTVKITLASGFLDMMANIFYLLAARSGYLILAVILTALYPGPTVFFQWLVLKERLNLSRITGLVLAIAGAALIGIGG